MIRLLTMTGSFNLSERDRRTLVVGIVTVLSLVLVFRGVPAWHRWVVTSRADAERLTMRLAIARQAARDARGAGRRADSLSRVSLGLAPALMDGDSPAQSTAALASYLSETAASAGVQLSGVQLTTDSLKKGAQVYRVRVRADGSGDIRGMTTLFQLLEGGGAPLIAVRSFSISQSEPGAPANHAETLRASFELEALARQPDEDP